MLMFMLMLTLMSKCESALMSEETGEPGENSGVSLRSTESQLT